MNSISSSRSSNSSHSRPPYIPNHIPDPSYIRILDTTLRDGEQSAGASMNSKQKLAIARQLAKLGVDVIDSGLPASSNDEFHAVKMIAQEVGNAVDDEGYVPVISGACRSTENDIRSAWEAVKYAKRPRIQMFLATSDIHMKYKLKKTKEEVIEIAQRMVKFARSLGCDDVGFCAEDGARSNREFLYEIFGEVIKAGATTVIVADTVGITLPREFGKLIADVKANTHGIENVIIAAHCHNDLGLATANTIEGACGGARQLEVTINGIGERAGNASLEEVVMILKCGAYHVFGGLYTRINTRHIFKTSKMVEEYTGLHVQPNKAIVGANAFSHESSIHQDGMLKHKSTYEIICPEDIGFERSDEDGIVLGKLSGRHGLRKRLQELGYELQDEQIDALFWSFKALAAQKKVDILHQRMQAFQSHFLYSLDKTARFATCRWIGTLLLASIYVMRVYYAQGFFLLSFALGIYGLDLFVSFLFEPDELEPSHGRLLPIQASDGSKTSIRLLPEYFFWYYLSMAISMSFIMTFIPIFNIPVVYQILPVYWIALFVFHMCRRIADMIY